MTQEPENSHASQSEANQADGEGKQTSFDRQTHWAKRLMSTTGYLMLLASIGLFAFIAYQSLRWPSAALRGDNQDLEGWILQEFTDDVLIFLGALILIIFGMRLLGAAGKGAPTTILADDRQLLEPLIREANTEAIRQYVILSSLSGFTGTFQKIGFSGLPLATVSLTLIFSCLSFLETEFLELAKLTLGAFIGSFVQKGSDTAKMTRE